MYSYQESSMRQKRKTGRRPTPTSLRHLKAMTPLTAPGPSQHSNTCFSVKLYLTCKSFFKCILLSFLIVK